MLCCSQSIFDTINGGAGSVLFYSDADACYLACVTWSQQADTVYDEASLAQARCQYPRCCK